MPIDFSLTDWRKTHGYTPGDVITDMDYSALMSDLGLPRYLSPEECKLTDISNTSLENSMSSKLELVIELLCHFALDLFIYLFTAKYIY